MRTIAPEVGVTCRQERENDEWYPPRRLRVSADAAPREIPGVQSSDAVLEKTRQQLSPSFVRELGAMVHLFAISLRRAIQPPYQWGAEFVAQFRFTIGVCLFPMVLTSFALSFGPAGIQASDLLKLFGALDRLGSAYELIVVREFAPLVVGIVLAGAAGTAICADLGARVVREEIDALKVLGIDPIKNLVVPRLLVLMLAALLFDVFALLAGLLGLVAVALENGAPLGPVFSTFFSNATALEWEGSLLKCAIYGAIIAIVSCYQGINVSGGPEAVGRAVNRSVVIAFLAIGFTDYVFTQLLLATHPILSQVRG
jgi:phospholipid/cholesterol/gamma-HCH transport system permease protein